MVVCLEIITGQNHQIQSMRGAVDELGYPGEDDCLVQVSHVSSTRRFSVESAKQFKDDCLVQVSHVSSTRRFSVESAKQFKDEKYCAQKSASSNDLVVVKCDGSQAQ